MVRSAMCSGCRALAGSSWSYLLTYLTGEIYRTSAKLSRRAGVAKSGRAACPNSETRSRSSMRRRTRLRRESRAPL